MSKNKAPYDEAFFEMAGRIPGEVKIPNKPKKPGLIIAVGADENRGEAHFHVYRNKVDWRAWKNGACLLFKDNKYFDHGNNRETLDRDELFAVVTKLKETHKVLGVSNWKYLITLWNDNNGRFVIYHNVPMPDYNYDMMGVICDEQ